MQSGADYVVDVVVVDLVVVVSSAFCF